MFHGTLRRVNWSIFTDVLKDRNASETSVKYITSNFRNTTEKTLISHADSTAHVFLMYLTSNTTQSDCCIRDYWVWLPLQGPKFLGITTVMALFIYLFIIHPQPTYFSRHPHHKCRLLGLCISRDILTRNAMSCTNR